MIQDLLQRHFGVAYHPHYIATLLKNMGFSIKRALRSFGNHRDAGYQNFPLSLCLLSPVLASCVVPIIRLPGTTIQILTQDRGLSRFHIRQTKLCYQNRFSLAQKV
jgi:hypothetical protein